MAFRHVLLTSAALALASVPFATAIAYADTVSLDQIPKPARDMILKQAGDDKIEKVDQETEKGATVFDAKIHKASGGSYDVKVDASGKLLKKG